jgi:hypothetical protein
MAQRFLFALLLVAGQSAAQDADMFSPDSVKKHINAVQIQARLHIDGKLDEQDWSFAKPSPPFVQIEPRQGMPATYGTDIKVLYNRQFLYVGIFAHDPGGKKAIKATDFKRDFNFRQHDYVALAIDGFNDGRNAMNFAVNAYGVQRDLLAFDDLYYDVDWDGLWQVRTTRTDSGWYAEIAIPWQTLRYPNSADSLHHWGFNAERNRRLSNELTAMSAFPRVFTSLRMQYAGVLNQLQPPPPKPNIRLQPYVLSSYDHYRNFDPSVTPEKTSLKFGGDLKWAINPNAVLDLTANTDFAQADADRQVNNVTRFSVFFPERRQFFLENASLFAPGVAMSEDASGGSMRIQPFFSRRIGLDDYGNPIPIDAGGRFVYRSSKENFGVMAMRQSGNDSVEATNFFVGRYAKNLGRQSRIGGLVTIKNLHGATNIVTAVDGLVRLGTSHSINTMVMQSVNTNGRKNGLAGYAQYYFSINQLKIWWTQSVVTKDFDPQMGFVSRSDVIGTTPGIFGYYRGKFLPFKKFLRALEPGLSPEFYHQASTGKLIERTVNFYPVWFNFQSGAYLGYGIVPTYQRLTEIFEPLDVTILPGKYTYTQQQIWASTNPSKIVNMQVIYTWGHYFNGRLNAGDWRLQIAPVPQFSLIARFNRNHFMQVGEPKTSAMIDLYSLEGRFALNPRLQLIGFYQQNSQNNSKNYNIRLSWEYKPLSYVYLVYNRNGFKDPLIKNQVDDHLIGKISYLLQL